MFKQLTSIGSRIRARRSARHLGTTIDPRAHDGADGYRPDPVVTRPPLVPIPQAATGRQPPALRVEWSRPEGTAARRFSKRPADNALIIEAGRTAAKGFYCGDPMNEPGFASLFAMTISDLTQAYLNDQRTIAPQVNALITTNAEMTAREELVTAQQQHGQLATRRPSVNATDADDQHNWVASTQAIRIIAASDKKLTETQNAVREAETARRGVADEMARSLRASARIGANRLRLYHNAFNRRRVEDGHVTLDALPQDLEQTITVQVLRAVRLALNPEQLSG